MRMCPDWQWEKFKKAEKELHDIEVELEKLGHPLAPGEPIVQKLRNMASALKNYEGILNSREVLEHRLEVLKGAGVGEASG